MGESSLVRGSSLGEREQPGEREQLGELSSHVRGSHPTCLWSIDDAETCWSWLGGPFSGGHAGASWVEVAARPGLEREGSACDHVATQLEPSLGCPPFSVPTKDRRPLLILFLLVKCRLRLLDAEGHYGPHRVAWQGRVSGHL